MAPDLIHKDLLLRKLPGELLLILLSDLPYPGRADMWVILRSYKAFERANRGGFCGLTSAPRFLNSSVSQLTTLNGQASGCGCGAVISVFYFFGFYFRSEQVYS